MKQEEVFKQRPLLQRISILTRHRNARERVGLHYVEGIRPVLAAMDAGIPIDTLVQSEVLLRQSYAQKRVRLAKRAGVPVQRVSPEEFRSVSRTPRASGLAAIARTHWTSLEDADPRRGLCWVAVGAIRSPGNLGTLLRTAHAVGAAGVMFLSPQVDPFDPSVVRASMGGIFQLQLVRTSPALLQAWATHHGCAVVGTSPHAALSYHEENYQKPLVVMFGEERLGMTPEEQLACTQMVRIPMSGTADSLNVGIAAGVLLFELQRRHASKP